MSDLWNLLVALFIAVGVVALVVWVISLASFGKSRPTITRTAFVVTCCAFGLVLAAFWLAATTSGAVLI